MSVYLGVRSAQTERGKPPNVCAFVRACGGRPLRTSVVRKLQLQKICESSGVCERYLKNEYKGTQNKLVLKDAVELNAQPIGDVSI